MIARPRIVVLAAAVLLAATGCGEEQPPAVGATASAPTPGPASPDAAGTPAAPTGEATTGTSDVRTLEVVVSNGEVSPPPGQVDLAVGESLRLVVTSDSDSELHAHGFEVSADVPAGKPTTIDLTGTAPGVYEVELHHPDLLLLQVAVR